MCCDDALLRLKTDCVADVKGCEGTIRELQEATASTTMEFMNRLISVQQDIHFYESDIKDRMDRIERLEELVERSGSDEDTLLDDVPLGDESSNNAVKHRIKEFASPKRTVSSDRTLDTVSLSYADGSNSLDGDDFLDYDNRMVASGSVPELPKYINHAA